MDNYLVTSIRQEIGSIFQRFTQFRDNYEKMTDGEFRERVTELIDSIFDYMFFLVKKIDNKIPESHMFREALIIQLRKEGRNRKALISDTTSFYLKQMLALDELSLKHRKKTYEVLEKARKQWEKDLRNFYEQMETEGR